MIKVTVKIALTNGDIMILKNVRNFDWKSTYVIVMFASGNNALFNANEVRYIAVQDDLET